MSEGPRHVHILDDVPELAAGPEAAGPALVLALDGFLDAGNGGSLAVEHLLSTSPGRVVASFEIDAFYDYRARRPPLTFEEDHYRDYEAPRLVVRLCQDGRGEWFLLLHGAEPDTHWEAFALAVRQVVEHFGVRLTLGLGAVPMAVPHTRPVMLTNHATSTRLLVQDNVWRGKLRIPASAASLLELRLGEWGHDAAGFVAHVPHYIAQGDYPAAAVALLEGVELMTGLEWDLADLRAAADARLVDISTQVEESSEAASLVAGLERQYDALEGTGEGSGLPLAMEGDLPTAEQLGDEFERFLAGLDPDDE